VLVKDAGRIYIVISTYYTGEKRSILPEYKYVGNITASDNLGKEYLERQYKRIKKHADMLLNTDMPDERKRLLSVADAIKERLEINDD